jgi:hypothetical protein
MAAAGAAQAALVQSLHNAAQSVTAAANCTAAVFAAGAPAPPLPPAVQQQIAAALAQSQQQSQQQIAAALAQSQQQSQQQIAAALAQSQQQIAAALAQSQQQVQQQIAAALQPVTAALQSLQQQVTALSSLAAKAHNAACSTGRSRAYVPVPNAAGATAPPNQQPLRDVDELRALTGPALAAWCAHYGIAPAPNTTLVRRRYVLSRELGLMLNVDDLPPQ